MEAEGKRAPCLPRGCGAVWPRDSRRNMLPQQNESKASARGRRRRRGRAGTWGRQDLGGSGTGREHSSIPLNAEFQVKQLLILTGGPGRSGRHGAPGPGHDPQEGGPRSPTQMHYPLLSNYLHYSATPAFRLPPPDTGPQGALAPSHFCTREVWAQPCWKPEAWAVPPQQANGAPHLNVRVSRLNVWGL